MLHSNNYVLWLMIEYEFNYTNFALLHKLLIYITSTWLTGNFSCINSSKIQSIHIMQYMSRMRQNRYVPFVNKAWRYICEMCIDLMMPSKKWYDFLCKCVPKQWACRKCAVLFIMSIISLLCAVLCRVVNVTFSWNIFHIVFVCGVW